MGLPSNAAHFFLGIARLACQRPGRHAALAQLESSPVLA